MLDVAKVTKDDVVYDLGSGDGRIVITAAQKYGVRGVGYDIDPERVKEAQENARTAGVADRVKFEVQNVFTADFKEATVVTMYLLPAVNLRLKPRLLCLPSTGDDGPLAPASPRLLDQPPRRPQQLPHLSPQRPQGQAHPLLPRGNR